MITIKNKVSLAKMKEAGRLLASLFEELSVYVVPGVSAFEVDVYVENFLKKFDLLSKSKGYKGYSYSSCVSLNDEVVHGIPSKNKVFKEGDLVKVDVCASWKGYCADMARSFFMGAVSDDARRLVLAAQQALDSGIAQARLGNCVSDISVAIQKTVEEHGFGIVREFAGHGIGKHMHEDPEVLNYGKPGKGPRLLSGMTFAIEPMITLGSPDIYILRDGWTVKTSDRSIAAHVEDTIAITEDGPQILTRV